MALSQSRRKLLARLRRRKGREREGLFVIEGIRTATEALEARASVEFAVLAPRVRGLVGGEALAMALEAAGVDVQHVDDAELASLADTEAPQGVLMVCRKPALALDDLVPRAAAETVALRLLVLDGVQDPGNAGTLVRCAAAFGLRGVLALDGSVDPWNAKAVRASAGAVFRIPVVQEDWERAGPWLGRVGVRRLAADASGVDVRRADAAAPWALFVGSEAAGLRPEVRAGAHARVSVPMAGGVESLNAAVAGAILLYVLTRERSLA